VCVYLFACESEREIFKDNVVSVLRPPSLGIELKLSRRLKKRRGRKKEKERKKLREEMNEREGRGRESGE